MFSTEPAGATSGKALTGQPVLTIEDAQGNAEPTDISGVALAIKSGSGISGDTLSGCTSTTMAGVAQFSGCQINDVGHGYSLTATDANDGGLTAVSGVFDVADAPFPFPTLTSATPTGPSSALAAATTSSPAGAPFASPRRACWQPSKGLTTLTSSLRLLASPHPRGRRPAPAHSSSPARSVATDGLRGGTRRAAARVLHT